ncbi:hypothetical protein IE994_16505 [Enterobacter hormaechei]|uniref:Uncharacterized protein n=1 Tax=Enterobacter hormaechei TaxID=158836 RepID=A0A927HMD3_9ENTR|nr:hypothetical protein [Enterobacter hormaechei]MBD3706724.1 hypothetical protein [Enterobacter hormaechei]MBD3717243.1 hypothetical protein [Enterobacter hormaechei]
METENNAFDEVLVDDFGDIAAELALTGMPSKPAQNKSTPTKESHAYQSGNLNAILGAPPAPCRPYV